MPDTIIKIDGKPILFAELSWAVGYWIGENGGVKSSRVHGQNSKFNADPLDWTDLTVYRRPYGCRYCVVCIRPEPGGKVVQRYVHRLVLET